MQTVDPMRLRAGLPLPQGDEAPPAGLDIGEALAALRRRWRGIALLGAVGLVVGLAAALALPPRFVAATQIAIDPRGLQVMDNEVTPRGLTQEGNAAILETQMRVLQSDLVLRKAVERERLGEDPEFNGDGGGLAARTRGALGAALGRAARPVDPELTALFTLRTRIRVQRAPGAYVVDLWVQSREAAKAARIAEAIARAFIEEQSSARREAARAASDALASRLDELRDRVTTAENAVEAFRSDNRIVGANGRLLNEQQLSDVSNQLVAARGRTGELRARFEQIQRIQRAGGVLDATFEVVQSPAIAGLRSRYSEIRRIEDDLVLKLGPRHPELTSVRAQAAGVQSQISAEVNRIAASIRNDYERARANEEALERSVGAMGQESGTVNSRLVRLRELEREAQASRAIYENFLNRTRETREQGEIDTTNIRIISPARPPLEPVGIPSAVIAAVAAALGLTLGSVGALARHALDGRVHSARGLSARTGLPVLAVVPGRRRRSSLADAPPQALMRLHDRLAEGRRAAAPVLAVTAPDGGEQVGEVALQVARAAELRGERVLLVDADPAGALTRLLGARGTGLAELLAGQAALVDVVRPVTDTRIGVVSSGVGLGEATPGAVEAGLALLLAPGTDHDLVVLCAGAADRNPHLRSLLRAAHEALLVVRSGETSFASLEDLRAWLGALAGRIGGAVLICDHAPAPRDARMRTAYGPAALAREAAP